MIVGLLQVGINDTLTLGCASCSSQILSAKGLSEYCASSSCPSLCRNWIYATWTSYSSIKLHELDVENFIIYFPSVVRPLSCGSCPFQIGKIGFSIGAGKTANVSLVMGPGSGYNLVR